MKVFQILNGMCYVQMNCNSVEELKGKFPPDIIFVEAPDYVNEHWGFCDVDKDGNPIEGDDRFIHPVAPEGWLYDDETGTFYEEASLPRMLEEAQLNKQNENKMLLSNWLNENPLVWINGKTYGITMEDQSEISLNINQYQVQVAAGVENPTLEWHAIHESCEPFTLEELSALTLAITNKVYPAFRLMNKYKEQIFACDDRKVVAAMELAYTDEAMAEAAKEEESTSDSTDTNTTEDSSTAATE